MAKLSDSEIAGQLSGMSGWRVENGQLAKTFEFDSYQGGVDFAVKVAREAENRDHHPDMLVTWRKVRISVSTHSEGGITEKDFALAQAVESF